MSGVCIGTDLCAVGSFFYFSPVARVCDCVILEGVVRHVCVVCVLFFYCNNIQLFSVFKKKISIFLHCQREHLTHLHVCTAAKHKMVCMRAIILKQGTGTSGGGISVRAIVKRCLLAYMHPFTIDLIKGLAVSFVLAVRLVTKGTCPLAFLPNSRVRTKSVRRNRSLVYIPKRSMKTLVVPKISVHLHSRFNTCIQVARPYRKLMGAAGMFLSISVFATAMRKKKKE